MMMGFIVVAVAILLSALVWGIAIVFYHPGPQRTAGACMFFTKTRGGMHWLHPKNGLQSATKLDQETDGFA